ncbi:MAG: cytoskeletal protein CcmA (bactofilin family) [Parvicellaceae bacterium]|jgi:cytoskeletal protein CcmA (bactofilin family)
MATGIIESISSDVRGSKTGIVKGNETGDLFNFVSQVITCEEEDPVSFNLNVIKGSDTTAVDLICIAGITKHPLSPLNEEHVGDVQVGPDQKLVIKSGGNVTGKLSIGGQVRIKSGGNVTGNIIINNAGTLKIIGGNVTGDIDLHSCETLKISAGGIVTGNVLINQGHKLVMDNGTITGSLDVIAAFKIVVKSDSSIGKG